MAEISLDDVLSARDSGDYGTALEKCVSYLSGNSNDPQARLLLANLYYLLDCAELAAEEVRRLLNRFPERKSLKMLHQALEPGSIESVDSSDEEGEHQTSEADETREAAESTEKSSTDASSIEEDDEDDVLAETDFDLDDLDLLSDEEEEER